MIKEANHRLNMAEIMFSRLLMQNHMMCKREKSVIQQKIEYIHYLVTIFINPRGQTVLGYNHFFERIIYVV